MQMCNDVDEELPVDFQNFCASDLGKYANKGTNIKIQNNVDKRGYIL